MGMGRRMTEALDLPKEVLLDFPLITMTGREEVTIENHKGILAYTEDSIRIGTKVGTVEIRGTALGLKQLTGEVLVITGRIGAVAFSS